jgi:hypothetical protein
MKGKRLLIAASIVSVFGLFGCSTMQVGSSDANTVATGGAGGANSQGANNQLAHCSSPLGTIAVTEDTGATWYTTLTHEYQLGSTTPVLKLLIQQSNCFVVVDRGRAMRSMMKERQLEKSGELRRNSRFGKGQMVSADYSITPSITFSNNNAGGIGGAVGGMFGNVGALIGGSLLSKQASTMLILDDNRSGVQVAAGAGSAQNWDIGGIGGLLGGPGFTSLGGYANTAEGKVIVAAFMDSYNKIVSALRNYRAQNVKGGLGTGGHLAVQGENGPDTQNAPHSLTLKQAQERLNELGFSVGKPDGLMGPQTRTELKRFQKSRGLQVTGTLDSATVQQLIK